MGDEDELALLEFARKDSEWLRDNYQSVIKEHDNQFIAVKGLKLVAFSATFEGLLNELGRKGIRPSLARIKFISSTPRIFF